MKCIPVVVIFFFQLFHLGRMLNNTNINNSPNLCTNNTDCGQNAFCSENGNCICHRYFTNSTRESNSTLTDQNCNYEMLSKASAFYLSFFLGTTGIDQLYLGNIAAGVLKFLIPVTLILVSSNIFMKSKIAIAEEESQVNKYMLTSKIIELITFIMIIVWWLIDWIFILSDFYTDESGIYMYNDL